MYDKCSFIVPIFHDLSLTTILFRSQFNTDIYNWTKLFFFIIHFNTYVLYNRQYLNYQRYAFRCLFLSYDHVFKPFSVTVQLSGKAAGTIQVTKNGVLGTICDDHFNKADAQVVCRMLGSKGYVRSDTFFYPFCNQSDFEFQEYPNVEISIALGSLLCLGHCQKLLLLLMFCVLIPLSQINWQRTIICGEKNTKLWCFLVCFWCSIFFCVVFSYNKYYPCFSLFLSHQNPLSVNTYYWFLGN